MITAHVRVRNEPLVFFALASVMPYIEKAIVYTTGSDGPNDYTIEDIKKAQKKFGNIELHEVDIPNAHGWTIAKLGRPEQKPSQALGDIRRKIHEMTQTTFSLVLDGDEVYPKKLIKAVVETAKNNMYGDNVLCAHVPVLDFYHNFQNNN